METIAFLVFLLFLLFSPCISTAIHECGHFLIAKLLKVPVLVFSLGNGNSVLTNNQNRTIFNFKWPLTAGYCTTIISKPWKMIAICMAGPVFELIAAFILLLLVFMTSCDFYNTEIASFTYSPITNISIVEQAGMKIGDKITHINGIKVNLYKDISIDKIKDNKIIVDFIRDGKEETIVIENAMQKSVQVGIKLSAIQSNGILKKELFLHSADSFDIGFNPVEDKNNFFNKCYYSMLNFEYTVKHIAITISDFFTGKMELDQAFLNVFVLIPHRLKDLYLMFLALLLLNSAIYNLLPSPSSDGENIIKFMFKAKPSY